MFVSEKIGALPFLGWVFDHGPVAAFIMTVLADFGIICLLMLLEGTPPWQRHQYKTFVWNDTVFIPLYAAVATMAITEVPPASGFYTQAWWHWAVLIAGFGISLNMEREALKVGQYTWSQELSPSKLWHTFIFGIVFYWIVGSLIPAILALWHLKFVSLMVVFIGAVIGFFYNSYRDATIRPFPPDAHLEGSWSKWDWHRRTY